MEYYREPRNNSTHLWSISLLQRRQECNREKTVSSISGAWKTGQLHVKNETRTFSNTTYKNKLKID